MTRQLFYVRGGGMAVLPGGGTVPLHRLRAEGAAMLLMALTVAELAFWPERWSAYLNR
jgi:hypothetical protein